MEFRVDSVASKPSDHKERIQEIQKSEIDEIQIVGAALSCLLLLVLVLVAIVSAAAADDDDMIVVGLWKIRCFWFCFCCVCFRCCV